MEGKKEQGESLFFIHNLEQQNLIKYPNEKLADIEVEDLKSTIERTTKSKYMTEL